jgi:hypothetical protein|tara:strand:- start:235 stop:513 length:279 start_codon:yes stop_codon:yes gene_type:complete
MSCNSCKNNRTFTGKIKHNWALAIRFLKALYRYARTGFKATPRVSYEERLMICSACPELNRKNKTCNICGCYIEKKAMWKSEDCPKGYWSKL